MNSRSVWKNPYGSSTSVDRGHFALSSSRGELVDADQIVEVVKGMKTLLQRMDEIDRRLKVIEDTIELIPNSEVYVQLEEDFEKGRATFIPVCPTSSPSTLDTGDKSA